MEYSLRYQISGKIMSEKSNEKKQKTNGDDLPNVFAEVALIIEVPTRGPCDEEQSTTMEKLSLDPTLLELVFRSIRESEEVENAMELLYSVALRHKEKYPQTRIRISPCLSLSQPEEI
jgi:hypothetical protein